MLYSIYNVCARIRSYFENMQSCPSKELRRYSCTLFFIFHKHTIKIKDIQIPSISTASVYQLSLLRKRMSCIYSWYLKVCLSECNDIFSQQYFYCSVCIFSYLMLTGLVYTELLPTVSCGGLDLKQQQQPEQATSLATSDEWKEKEGKKRRK